MTTFAGARFSKFTKLPQTDNAQLAHHLTNHEFNIAGQLTADIAVTPGEPVDSANQYVIAALVLED